MSGSRSWVYQGRQYHGWFGHGTAPKDGTKSENEQLHSSSAIQRIDAVIGSVLPHIQQGKRRHWDAVLQATKRPLADIVRAWSLAPNASQKIFNGRFLNQYTNDHTVELLRKASSAIIKARTLDDIIDAGHSLAAAVKQIGIDQWPNFVRDAAVRIQASVDSNYAGLIDDDTLSTQYARIITYHNETAGYAHSKNLSLLTERDRNYCIALCSELALPTGDYGTNFFRCVETCTGDNPHPDWEPYFK